MHEASPAELRPGDTLGPYRLDEQLGEGALGVVFRAVDPDGRTVALKILKQELSGDDAYERRFRREARVAAEVRHPRLVRVLEDGVAGGRHYLAAEYVPGGSLEQRLHERDRLSIPDTLRVVADAGAGLDALHRAGLVHRDVKPSNILVDPDGRLLLADFGLARGPAYTVLTRAGALLGTPDYLAPELVHGDVATPASDVYALGCVAYECLTGAPPFHSDNVLETIAGHVDAEPPDPRPEREDVPPAFATVLLLALAKDPDERPGTARSYAQLLAAARKA